jgi:6-phosphogluconate dehydrogenase
MNDKQCEMGMIGLGVMGANFALNIAEHGFSIAGYDRDLQKVSSLASQAGKLPVLATARLKDFVESLEKPKVIMLLVPAGKPVDTVISELMPYLSRGDIIIDGGNSHFTDTDTRGRLLEKKGIFFLGVGISGGEAGARHGPSMMPGGPERAYQRVKPIFEAAAAHVNGSPCAAYMGPGSAGHYVKMVHNGIEYGLMQLIAETYDIMKRGLGFDELRLSSVYDEWNRGELNSFLLEITVEIFRKIDEKTGKYLIDVILDEAKQKGTGMWTSESAMQLQMPVPTIDTAVEMRDLSVFKILREEESKLLAGPDTMYSGNKEELVTQLSRALYAAFVLTYVQGFALLYRASEVYNYGLKLADAAGIWRGGCIIRSAVIEKIHEILSKRGNIEHLLDEPALGEIAVRRQESLRFIVKVCAELGIPAPAMTASLSYFDSFRSAWLPANLIQAQRDYFGSHTYERVDAKGTFHTLWHKEAGEQL